MGNCSDRFADWSPWDWWETQPHEWGVLLGTSNSHSFMSTKTHPKICLEPRKEKFSALPGAMPSIQVWAMCCFTLSSSQADSRSCISHLLFSFSRTICLQLVHSSCLWGSDQNLQESLRHRDVHVQCSKWKMQHISAKFTQGSCTNFPWKCLQRARSSLYSEFLLWSSFHCESLGPLFPCL